MTSYDLFNGNFKCLDGHRLLDVNFGNIRMIQRENNSDSGLDQVYKLNGMSIFIIDIVNSPVTTM